MLTSQDIIKGIDITGLTDVTGSELDQLVDVARPANDKGLIIVTRDTFTDTPVVPDPNLLLEGVIPTHWTRYIWKREPFNNYLDGIKLYVWNEALVFPHPTLLKWQYTNQKAEDAYDLAVIASTEGSQAQVDVAAAQVSITNAEARITSLEEDLADANENITIQAQQIAALQANSLFITGEIKEVAGNKLYSTTEDQGWLNCDGKAVSRTTFANLFAEIGVFYGAGDGTTTFNVPDKRGRVAIGDNGPNLPNGTNGALTATVRGQSGGAEQIKLTGRQSGIQQHHHSMGITGDAVGAGLPGAGNNSGSPALNTADTGHTDALDFHSNMQPWLATRFIIKT